MKNELSYFPAISTSHFQFLQFFKLQLQVSLLYTWKNFPRYPRWKFYNSRILEATLTPKRHLYMIQFQEFHFQIIISSNSNQHVVSSTRRDTNSGGQESYHLYTTKPTKWTSASDDHKKISFWTDTKTKLLKRTRCIYYSLASRKMPPVSFEAAASRKDSFHDVSTLSSTQKWWFETYTQSSYLTDGLGEENLGKKEKTLKEKIHQELGKTAKLLVDNWQGTWPIKKL